MRVLQKAIGITTRLNASSLRFGGDRPACGNYPRPPRRKTSLSNALTLELTRRDASERSAGERPGRMESEAQQNFITKKSFPAEPRAFAVIAHSLCPSRRNLQRRQIELEWITHQNLHRMGETATGSMTAERANDAPQKRQYRNPASTSAPQRGHITRSGISEGGADSSADGSRSTEDAPSTSA